MEDLFAFKAPTREKLLSFGFRGEPLCYEELLPETGFVVRVEVGGEGHVRTSTFDPATGEPYTLHLVEGAEGNFIGQVRAEYRALLERIARECFSVQVFRGKQAQDILSLVGERYGAEPEYPWGPEDGAVVRRADNRKWFGVFLLPPKKSLFGEGEGVFEVLNVRIPPEELDAIADGERYFRAYHMNKKHWVTLPLDGRIPREELLARLDQSYAIAEKKK